MNLNDLNGFFIKSIKLKEKDDIKLIKNLDNPGNIDNFITKKNYNNIRFNTNKIKYILEI